MEDIYEIAMAEHEAAVREILRQTGIPTHVKGYSYLCDAIRMVLYDGSLLKGICRELYPLVAWKYSTTPHGVERDIRYAIGLAWDRDNGEAAARVFGDNFGGRKPTNS